MATKKKPPTYERNVILQSPASGCFYFVSKAKVLESGVRMVVGKKIDVTASIKELFGPMLKREQTRLLKLARSARKARAQTAH